MHAYQLINKCISGRQQVNTNAVINANDPTGVVVEGVPALILNRRTLYFKRVGAKGQISPAILVVADDKRFAALTTSNSTI